MNKTINYYNVENKITVAIVDALDTALIMKSSDLFRKVYEVTDKFHESEEEYVDFELIFKILKYLEEINQIKSQTYYVGKNKLQRKIFLSKKVSFTNPDTIEWDTCWIKNTGHKPSILSIPDEPKQIMIKFVNGTILGPYTSEANFNWEFKGNMFDILQYKIIKE